MKTLILSVLALASLTGSLSADDKDKADRDRKARVALALAGTGKAVAVATAPAPHAKVTSYPEGYAKATADVQPLVVFVGLPMVPVKGAVVAQADTFAGVEAPAVVVGYPVADRLMIHATLKGGDVTPAAVQKASDAAGKKIDAPPAKDMPAPKPLDWSVLTSDEIAAGAEFVGLFRNRRGSRGSSCANCPGCSNAPQSVPVPEVVESPKKVVSDPPAKALPSAGSFAVPQSNCPGGVCPVQSAPSSARGGGWYLGKNLGR